MCILAVIITGTGLKQCYPEKKKMSPLNLSSWLIESEFITNCYTGSIFILLFFLHYFFNTMDTCMEFFSVS